MAMAILKWRITHGSESERPSAYWNLDWKVEIEEVKIGAVSKVGMTRTVVVLYGERKKVVRLAETGAHDIDYLSRRRVPTAEHSTLQCFLESNIVSSLFLQKSYTDIVCYSRHPASRTLESRIEQRDES